MAKFPFISPDGRIGRREYWLTYAGLAAGLFLVNDMAPGWPFGLACVVAAWVGVAAAVKRMHDCDYSAWWLTLHLLWAVPALGCPVGLLLAGYRREGVLLFLAVSFFWALWWVWLTGFSRSSPEANEYGPPHSGSLLWTPPPPAKTKPLRAAGAQEAKPTRLAGANDKRPLRL